MFCENCGAQVNPGAKICIRCGKPPREERSLLKKLFFLAVAAALIAALLPIYAGYFYLGQAYKEWKQSEASAAKASNPAPKQDGTPSGDTDGRYDMVKDRNGYFRMKNK